MVFLSGDGDSSATVPAQDGPGASLAITVAAVSDERGHRTGMLREHFSFKRLEGNCTKIAGLLQSVSAHQTCDG